MSAALTQEINVTSGWGEEVQINVPVTDLINCTNPNCMKQVLWQVKRKGARLGAIVCCGCGTSHHLVGPNDVRARGKDGPLIKVGKHTFRVLSSKFLR